MYANPTRFFPKKTEQFSSLPTPSFLDPFLQHADAPFSDVINAEIVQKTRHVARELENRVDKNWQPFGRPTWIVDGFTFTLPATPENLERFQCHPAQHPDVAFPIPRAIAILSLATGCLLDFTYSNYSGKGTGEISMLRAKLDVFRSGDLVVFDALYCSFPTIALLKQSGVDVVVRMSGSRLVVSSFFAAA